MTGIDKMLELFPSLAQQVAEDAFFDIEEIGGSGCQVAVLDTLQRLGIAAHHPADGIFSSECLGTDQIFDLAGQVGILNQQGMSAEDGAVLPAQLVTDRLLIDSRFACRRARASRKRLTSSSCCSIRMWCWGIRNHSVLSTRAGPIATPVETAIPRFVSMQLLR